MGASVTYTAPVLCSRRSCGRIYNESDARRVQDGKNPRITRFVCPHCGCNSFYYVNAAGKRKKRDEERAMSLTLPAPAPSKDEVIAALLAALQAAETAEKIDREADEMESAEMKEKDLFGDEFVGNASPALLRKREQVGQAFKRARELRESALAAARGEPAPSKESEVRA